MIVAMKWIASLVLAAALLAACGEGTGTSGECAFGGALTDCPDAERTPEAACWRLVDCGAIVVEADNEETGEESNNDWGGCVNVLESLTEDRQRIAVNCVAASTCDELRVDGFCFEFLP